MPARPACRAKTPPQWSATVVPEPASRAVQKGEVPLPVDGHPVKSEAQLGGGHPRVTVESEGPR